jgi:hypothetical protein
LAIVIAAPAFAEAPASDRLKPITLRQLKVGGEIGRRIDVTVADNLLAIGVDQEFLRPFREKKSREGGYVGLGKLIDTLVRLAAYTGDERVLSLKRKVVEETIRTQEPDGYIGIFVPENRVWTLWDAADMGYVVYGLTSDGLVKGRKAQSGRVAVMRGPLVFCLNRSRHKELAQIDLRLLTLDPSSLEGPVADNTARPGGLACRVRAWRPGSWYPMARPDLRLTLTEFADPGGEATYFHVPDPNGPGFGEDELIQPEKRR